MSIELTHWTEGDLDHVRELAGHASLAAQNEPILGPGRLEHWLADPLCDPALRWLARVDGRPVGFAYGFLLHDAAPPWADASRGRRARTGSCRRARG